MTDETIKSLENIIKTCQALSGHERCFLNDSTAVKCQYMGEKNSEWLTNEKTGHPYLSECFTCKKYEGK